MEDSVASSEREIPKSNDGIIDYWRSKQRAFPILSKIAHRVLAVLAPLASGERDFSLRKLSIGKQRCNMKEDRIDDKDILHSEPTETHEGLIN